MDRRLRGGRLSSRAERWLLERALVLRAKGGDHAAFAELVRPHIDRLHGLAAKISRMRAARVSASLTAAAAHSGARNRGFGTFVE